jgi:hypothetical protein
MAFRCRQTGGQPAAQGCHGGPNETQRPQRPDVARRALAGAIAARQYSLDSAGALRVRALLKLLRCRRRSKPPRTLNLACVRPDGGLLALNPPVPGFWLPDHPKALSSGARGDNAGANPTSTLASSALWRVGQTWRATTGHRGNMQPEQRKKSDFYICCCSSVIAISTPAWSSSILPFSALFPQPLAAASFLLRLAEPTVDQQTPRPRHVPHIPVLPRGAVTGRRGRWHG